MIPFLAAAANGDTLKKAGLVVGGLAAVGITYFVISKQIKKSNIKQAARKYGDGSKEGKAVEYAGMFYSALHSGMFSMTEDERSIYSTALSMYQNGINMKLVGDAYRNLYQKELVVELNRLLDADELIIFNNALNGKYKKVSKTKQALKTASFFNPMLTPLTWFSK